MTGLINRKARSDTGRIGFMAFFMIFMCGLFLLTVAESVHADIYRYIDKEGVMHFTNTPTSSKYKRYMWGNSGPYLWKRTRTYFGSHSPDQYNHIISEASRRHGIDSRLVKAIIKVESDFNPLAVSRKGAKGLMQIMPDNYRSLRIRDPFDPAQNIMGGTRYFRTLLDRFNNNITFALAAYNAGPASVDRFNRIPPIPETEAYVRRVMEYYAFYKQKD
jgi:soluble lytic murein transglycosylase